MQISEIDIRDLKPYKLNAKLHPDSQIEGLAESIKRFGFIQPVVIDKNNEIIIGHGRVQAANKSGLRTVPCVKVENITEQEVKALRLIDNRIAETGWDVELLGLDLVNIDFDFKPFNVDFSDLVSPRENVGLTDPDEVPEHPKEPKSKLGDLYQLGDHRVLCGDSTNKDDVEKLFGLAKPFIMVTDPPYGVEYDPEWRNDAAQAGATSLGSSGARAIGKVKNDSNADWTDVYKHSLCDVAYVWHASLHGGVVASSMEAANFVLRSQIIWKKSRFAISRGHYHWQHECAFYAVVKGKTSKWHGDRTQSTIWEIGHVKNETGHGTQKPVECMARPIRNHGGKDDDVYDPFLGSGTTIIAAEKLGRRCFGIEIDPVYVDVIVKRWEDFTGKKAILVN